MFNPEVAKLLNPESAVHKDVLAFVRNVKNFSSTCIKRRHPQWRENEESYRAYLNIEEYSKARKKKAHPDADYPGTVPIIVPMAMAGVHSYLSFLMAVFGETRPIFRLRGRGPEDIKPAENMEGILDYQVEHERVRGLLKLFFWFQDALVYGSGFVANSWSTVVEQRALWEPKKLGGISIPWAAPDRVIQDVTVYEGNILRTLDPYRCYPDPRVPLSDIQSGDIFGFSYKKSLHALGEEPDKYFNLEYVGKKSQQFRNLRVGESSSKRQTLVQAFEGGEIIEDAAPGFPECFELWCRIRPNELGLTDSAQTELWVLTVANGDVVIGAEKAEVAGQHMPVSCIEFIPCGSQFMNQSFVEAVAGLQNHFSWLFNSRMEAARRIMNALIVFDPSRIEGGDLERDRLVKYIRLNPSAYGTDPRGVVHQIMLQDPTTGYSNDLMIILDIYQRLTGVSDMVQGLPAKGRRTATEMGGVQGAAASRLKLVAEIFSIGGVIPLVKMMVQNIQQFATQPMYARVLGKDYLEGEPKKIQPWEVAGEFDYPVNDGTAPLEKNRQAEVWKEILMGVGQSEYLSQRLDVFKIFQQLAKTLDIKNIQDFEVQQFSPTIMPNDKVSEMAKAGNAVPVGGPNGAELSDLVGLLGNGGRPE